MYRLVIYLKWVDKETMTVNGKTKKFIRNTLSFRNISKDLANRIILKYDQNKILKSEIRVMK